MCSLAVAAGPELLIVGNRIPKTFMPKSSSLAGQAVAKGIVCHDVRASNRSVPLLTCLRHFATQGLSRFKKHCS